MAPRHLDALFSPAYDGALDDAARGRFDAHLAGCPPCAAAFADFAAAVDAVRAQPQTRMPVPVRLPTGDPVAAPPGLALVARWRTLIGPRRLLAGGAALTGVAAVVLVVAVAGLHGGGGSATSPGQANRGAVEAPLQAGGGSGAAASSAFAAFPNHVSAAVPGRPGAELLLGTPTDVYAAGSSVVVYARLLDAAGGATLPSVVVSAAHTAVSGAAAPDAAGPRRAEPAPAAAADGLPLLEVALPPGLHHGDRVELVATVPGSGGAPALSVTLTITVA